MSTRLFRVCRALRGCSTIHFIRTLRLTLTKIASTCVEHTQIETYKEHFYFIHYSTCLYIEV